MELELHLTNIVLSMQILFLVLIVHVVGLQNECLLLLKEVVNLDLRNEVRVQVVINALSPAHLGLQRLVALLLHLVQHNERIRLRESVHVRQVPQAESKTQRLFQLGCVCIADVTFDRLEGCIVDILASLHYGSSTDCSGIVLCLRGTRLKYSTHFDNNLFVYVN